MVKQILKILNNYPTVRILMVQGFQKLRAPMTAWRCGGI